MDKRHLPKCGHDSEFWRASATGDNENNGYVFVMCWHSDHDGPLTRDPDWGLRYGDDLTDEAINEAVMGWVRQQEGLAAVMRVGSGSSTWTGKLRASVLFGPDWSVTEVEG